MKDLSLDLFINCEHLHKLRNASVSTARRDLRGIRIKFGIYKPHRVTRDHACLFYNITLQQYITRLKDDSNNNNPPHFRKD